MEEVIEKVKEVIQIKAGIAKQENLLWQKAIEALDVYLKYQQKLPKPKLASSVNEPDRYVDTKGAAKYLGLSVGTMHGWRFYGTGPKYIKMGRSVRYRIEDLEDFAAKNVAKQSPPYPSSGHYKGQ